jgi:hypothetical protein
MKLITLRADFSATVLRDVFFLSKNPNLGFRVHQISVVNNEPFLCFYHVKRSKKKTKTHHDFLIFDVKIFTWKYMY